MVELSFIVTLFLTKLEYFIQVHNILNTLYKDLRFMVDMFQNSFSNSLI